jgi:predicted DNA-binding transcriptional regulator AlpA
MQHTAPMPAVEFLRGPAAAKFLNISYAHFRLLLKKGKGPKQVALGSHAKLYAVESLRRFMNEQER